MKHGLLIVALIVALLAGAGIAGAQGPDEGEAFLAWTLAGSRDSQTTLQMQIFEAGLAQDYINHAEMTWINNDSEFAQIVLKIYYPATMEAEDVFADIFCTLGELHEEWRAGAISFGCVIEDPLP